MPATNMRAFSEHLHVQLPFSDFYVLPGKILRYHELCYPQLTKAKMFSAKVRIYRFTVCNPCSAVQGTTPPAVA
jgi:hypothetical protein